MNTSAQKNELIFGYSSGNLGEAKSLFVSMSRDLNLDIEYIIVSLVRNVFFFSLPKRD